MTEATLHRLRLPMAAPVRGVTERLVTLEHGPEGWGESSPFPGYRVDQQSCDEAMGESASRPMPDAVRDAIAVSALIADGDAASAVAAAERAVGEGYRVVKMKVGDPDDIARVGAVRAAVGDGIRIRVDANGTWQVPVAIERLNRFADMGVELCEEPASGLESLASVRESVSVPIAADESVRSIDDAARLAKIGAVDALVLKVQACGGVWSALEWAHVAGVPAIVTSMIETSVGIGSGLALAAALPELPYACGLGTATLLAADIVDDPLIPVGGLLVNRRPTPSDDLLAAYAVSG